MILWNKKIKVLCFILIRVFFCHDKKKIKTKLEIEETYAIIMVWCYTVIFVIL